ncbi:hypothetical protein Pyn_09711 [Prunus yedoensis var. nudiflora]|uniref:Uncharacterized protein n=1 Tax=Prunus yedoensis var. nudiflora TaxID=2094558 RepID=A0A314UMI3_PRUYE|nr:hypothetical protein Pyn_09711 [Prunus yedoensis var. nudiflora]
MKGSLSWSIRHMVVVMFSRPAKIEDSNRRPWMAIAFLRKGGISDWSTGGRVNIESTVATDISKIGTMLLCASIGTTILVVVS